MTRSFDDGTRRGWYRRTQPSTTRSNLHHAWPHAGVVPEPPPDLLRRHGARVSPATGDESAGATVYRAETLLAPTRLLRQRPALLASEPAALDGVLNRQLAPVGWYVENPSIDDARIVTRLTLRRLSALSGHNRHAANRIELVPDAFQALQLLRQATAGGEDAEAVAQISLEHLFFAISSIGGMPITEGHGDHTRTPVAVLAPAPPRRLLADLRGGRRPVVAVLDTGVGAHTWFDANASNAMD